ncbi:uncharacterized protein JCM6883_001040 [Sporobolomyces salmoneus]|uniref:uncharacterized protein n=1 Tax=Sporobolomyces salmoneus TaxID=183962 RepID=UPI00317970E9
MARERLDTPPSAKRRRVGIEPLPDNPLQGKLGRPEPHDTIQMSTWNVAGLDTSNGPKWRNAFRMYVEAEDPHILSITEVKDKDPQKTFERGADWAFLRARYPYRYWSNQVAIVSKLKPIAEPIYGFPDGAEFDEAEGKARMITLEFKECFFIATYVPNSGDRFKSIDRRRRWNADFEKWIRSLDEKKAIVWSGDFNVVRPYSPTTPRPAKTPLSEWKSPDVQWYGNYGQVGGTHPDEIKAHEKLLGPQPESSNPRRPGKKFVDVWRLMHGEGFRQYTHSSKHLGGWRLDGFIISERFLYHVRKCQIRYAWKDEYWAKPEYKLGAASDHWPVWISFELERSDFEGSVGS